MRRVVAVLVLLLGAIWLTLGFLVDPFVPGGAGTIAAIALLATPLPLAWLLGARQAGRYPSRLARLLLLRPFWYVQLLLLLAAPAGLVGIVVGLPFGRARLFGLVAAGLVAAAFAVAALVGYAGSRRLVVRRLDAASRPSPALDGCASRSSRPDVGPHTSRRFLARALAHVRDAKRLVAVTGDMIDDTRRTSTTRRGVRVARRAARRLRRRGQSRVYPGGRRYGRASSGCRSACS